MLLFVNENKRWFPICKKRVLLLRLYYKYRITVLSGPFFHIGFFLCFDCNLNFMIMKKYLFFSFFFLSSTIISCTNNDIVVNDLENNDIKCSATIEESMKTYSDLIDSFKKGETRLTNETIYPDYYGGAYIDDDGLLVIWVKDNFDIPIILSENSSIIIKKALYSYNELSKIMDTIDEFKEQSHSLQNLISSNIYMWSLDEKNNRVEVCLKDCSPSAIEEFKRVVTDSPAVVFTRKESISDMWNKVDIIYKNALETRSVINVYAGEKIYAAAEGTSIAKPGSFGYKAQRNGVEGFVTAGHVAAVNDLISIPADNGNSSVYLIGKCTVSKHENNGNLDAAFCVITSSSFAVTNQIGNTGKTYSQFLYRNYAVGSPVFLCGGITSSSGKITSLKVSTEDDETGIVIKDMVKADYASEPGDSGGLVYMTISNINYILGVHHSGTHSGSTHVTTFCPAIRIQDDMGILPSV